MKFSNIDRYSEASNAALGCTLTDNQVTLQFCDNGHLYAPTDQENPDITASVEDRKIGDLGIFLVKRKVDEVAYEYKDGLNILTLVKNL